MEKKTKNTSKLSASASKPSSNTTKSLSKEKSATKAATAITKNNINKNVDDKKETSSKTVKNSKQSSSIQSDSKTTSATKSSQKRHSSKTNRLEKNRSQGSHERIRPEFTSETKKDQELPFLFNLFNKNLLENSSKLFQQQFSYWQNALDLLNTVSEKTAATSSNSAESKPKNLENSLPTDKRFKHEAWDNQPFFNFLKEYYLLNSQYFKSLIEEVCQHIEDKKIKNQIHFITQQWLDALSPSNFLMTNPEVHQLALQTQGKSLWNGLQQFIQDLEHDSGTLNTKITDLSAFQVGENLAITKGKVIFQNDLIQLIKYEPQTAKVYEKPILFVPPWINKFYILDLQPHNSLVNYLVKNGFTVFMISWVNPDASHGHKKFEDYLLEGPLAAIEFIREHLQQPTVNVLGYCIGGTLLGSFLAYLAAKNKPYVASATFLATLFDFSEPGDLGVFIDDEQLHLLEQHMQKKGYLEGSVMAATFNSLRANDLIWGYFVNNYLKGQKPPAFDLLFWNADSTNMPAQVHHTYLHDMYLHNLLVKPQHIKLNGVPIDLGKIKIPTYSIATQDDHIAPWTACYKSMLNMNGPKKFVLAGSGHVAGIINPPEKNKYGYYTYNTLPQNPLQWLNHTKPMPGSWWQDWLKWLTDQSGKLIDKSHHDLKSVKPIETAPGSYVLKKCQDKIPKDIHHYFIEKMKWFTEKTFEQFKEKASSILDISN